MPEVINIKDTGYKIPEGAVYVGRANPRYHLSASKWANPLTIREVHALITRLTEKEAHQFAVNWYKEYLAANPVLLEDLYELKGKDLACWCHNWDGQGGNPMYCHADVLLKLANERRQ